MKAIIEIEILKVNGIKINQQVIEENPKFSEATQEVINNLSKQLKIYFQTKKIKVNIKNELKK